MEDLLQANLLYLYQNHRDMFEQIQQYMDDNVEKNCKLVYNDNGTINLSYALQDGVKLLYADDEEDINSWMRENSDLTEGKYDIVMYGLGLSHHLARLLQSNSNLSFYIYEPEIDILIESLKVMEIAQLLEHPQIKMLQLGSEAGRAIFYTLLHTYSENPKIDVFLPFYTEINLEDILQFYYYNYSFREAEAIELGFSGLFRTQPYRNSIRNLAKMYHSHSLKEIKNKFTGRTALIVGAGPSLELDIEHIRQNRDKLLIIAAGSSIQSLLHYGVVPHLSVTMDPGEANGRVFANKDFSEVTVVYVPQVYYSVLDQNFKQFFYAFFKKDPIIEYLFPGVDEELKLRASNSVTGTAVQVAAYLGVEQIVFAGQDLSFPNNQYYASGANHTNNDNRIDKIKTSNLEVENVKGSMNTTNLSMRSALEDIERLIASINDVKFINTSSLGAKIKGTDFVPLSHLINEIETKQNITESLETIDVGLKIDQYDGTKILIRLKSAIDTCDQLVNYTKNSLRLIDKIDQLCRSNPDKAMTTLAKLEQEFSQVTEDNLFKLIIPSWNIRAMKKYDQQIKKIEEEPTMVGKARLLNQIVVPFMKTIEVSFNEIKQELQQVNDKIQESMNLENR